MPYVINARRSDNVIDETKLWKHSHREGTLKEKPIIDRENLGCVLSQHSSLSRVQTFGFPFRMVVPRKVVQTVVPIACAYN